MAHTGRLIAVYIHFEQTPNIDKIAKHLPTETNRLYLSPSIFSYENNIKKLKLLFDDLYYFHIKT